MKRGFFGGSFNPPHNGHIQSLLGLQKKLGLKVIHIIPSHKNPLKLSLEGPGPEDRFEMTQLAFRSYGDQFFVDDREIKRKGKSYTIDTVRELRKEFPKDELYMIIGADLFEELPEWKEFNNLLSETNIVVMTRPGHELPSSEEELPEWLKPFCEDFDFNFVQLKSDKTIQFVSLPEIDISATNIRKRLRLGRPVDQFIPLSTENFIREKGLYKKQPQKLKDYDVFLHSCAKVLHDKKGISIVGFDLQGTSPTTDFALIASGTSTRHASSLAESVIRSAKEEFNISPYNVEGLDEGRWVVVDYGSLMIHIFYDFVRQEYNLENLWKNSPPLNLKLT
jgi:nicotinate-nucleotide adenylyltransferase